MRYVFAGKAVVSVGDIFEHVETGSITELSVTFHHYTSASVARYLSQKENLREI